MFISYNNNPADNYTGDCVIRAISTATHKDWDEVWLDIMVIAFKAKDMMSSNRIWQDYLHQLGFTRYNLPDTCPDCYTVKNFTEDFPKGVYVLGTGTHVVAVVDGDHYDTWDSGKEVPIYYWKRG